MTSIVTQQKPAKVNRRKPVHFITIQGWNSTQDWHLACPWLHSYSSLWRKRGSRRHSWQRNYSASIVLNLLLGLKLSCLPLVPLASVSLLYHALFANTQITASTSARIWSRLTTCPRRANTPRRVLTLPTRPLMHPLLVLVISTPSYDSITYYHGLPYLLPTCFSFIAAL